MSTPGRWSRFANPTCISRRDLKNQVYRPPKARSLNPTVAEAHATKGRVLAELGRYDEALVAHEESLRLQPDSFDVQANFANTCILLGDLEAAIAHFERAA